MSILLDAGIILLFAIFIVSGLKRGLVRSLIGFVATVIAIVLSMYLSKIASIFIYDNFIKNNLLVQINDILNEYVGRDLNEKTAAVFNELPKMLSNTLMFCGVTSNVVGDVIENSTGNASYELVKLFSPTIISVIRTILVPFIFVVIYTPLNFLNRIIGRIFKVPGLRQIDQVLGAIIGALKGFLLIVLITFLLKMFLPMMSNIPDIFSKNTIESTFLFKEFYRNNIIYDFLQSE